MCANFGFGALVSRFRSSQILAATSSANIGFGAPERDEDSKKVMPLWSAYEHHRPVNRAPTPSRTAHRKTRCPRAAAAKGRHPSIFSNFWLAGAARLRRVAAAKANFCDGHHSAARRRHSIARSSSSTAALHRGRSCDEDQSWSVGSGWAVPRRAADSSIGRAPLHLGAARRLHGRCPHAVQFGNPEQGTHRVVLGVQDVGTQSSLPGAVYAALTCSSMIPKKPAPDLIRGHRFFQKSCSNDKPKRDDDSKRSHHALGSRTTAAVRRSSARA